MLGPTSCRASGNVNVDSTTSLWKCGGSCDRVRSRRAHQPARGAAGESLGAEVSELDVRELTEPRLAESPRCLPCVRRPGVPRSSISPPTSSDASPPGSARSARPNRWGRTLPRSDHDHGAFNVANLSETGELLDDAAHEWNRTLAGNFEWHTDSSYLPVSAQASMLSAHVVPSTRRRDRMGRHAGGVGLAATDAPPPGRGAARLPFVPVRAEPLAKVAPFARGEDYRVGCAVAPLVKQHPATGRSALYIGRHAFGVKGLSDRGVRRAPLGAARVGLPTTAPVSPSLARRGPRGLGQPGGAAPRPPLGFRGAAPPRALARGGRPGAPKVPSCRTRAPS